MYNPSHSVRFILAKGAFHEGLSVKQTVELFRGMPDFDEKITFLQLKHVFKAWRQKKKK